MNAIDLRRRIAEALACIDRGESVIINYRGKPRARMVSIEDPPDSTTEPEENWAFGMWADREDMRDVDAYMADVRKPRYAR